jgi:hypothetical protein
MNQAMKAVLAILLGTLVTLAAVSVIILAALRVAAMPHSLARALATAAELILGVLLLIGAIYLALQIVVRLLAKDSRS